MTAPTAPNAKRLRVLHLIDHLGTGGAQEVLLELARSLDRSSLDNEVGYLFGQDTYVASIRAEGVPVHDLSSTANYTPLTALDPRPAWRLRRLLRKGDYDIVHVHLYVGAITAVLARAFLRGTRPPIIVTPYAPKEHLPWFVFAAYRALRRWIDHWQVAGLPTRDDVLSIGVDPARISFQFLGISMLDEPRPDAVRAWRSRLDIEPHHRVVTSIARLHPQRFVDRLMRSFAKAVELDRDSGKDWIFLVVGDGPHEPELRSLAATLDVAEQIRWAGRTSELAEIFALTDLFVTLGFYGDVSHAAMQSVTSGVPAVAVEVLTPRPEGPPDYQICPVAPDLESFAPMIVRYMHDEDLRAENVRHGADMVRQNFSVSAMVDAHRETYFRVATGHGYGEI